MVRVVAVAAAAILMLAGCADDGGGEIASDAPVEQVGGSDAAPLLEPCPTGAGDVLTVEQATEGCAGPGGDVVMLGVHQCVDGRMLLGDAGLWGWVGEPLEATDDVASDPGFAAAYDECVGG